MPPAGMTSQMSILYAMTGTAMSIFWIAISTLIATSTSICLETRGEKIEKWLSPPESEKLYYDLQQNSVDTGKWLFEDEKLRIWESGGLPGSDELQNLHLYGSWGSGKTFYATRVVNYLRRKQKSSASDFRIFHLLLDPNTAEFKRQGVEPRNITKDVLIGDLLKQLSRGLEGKFPSLRRLFNEMKQTGAPLEWPEACRI